VLERTASSCVKRKESTYGLGRPPPHWLKTKKLGARAGKRESDITIAITKK
jgi:hypothetical protein